MNITNTPPTTPINPPDSSGGDIPVGKIFATDDALTEAFAAAEAAAQRRAGLTDLETKRFPAQTGDTEVARPAAYITHMQHPVEFIGKRFAVNDDARGFRAEPVGNFYSGTAHVHTVPTSHDLQSLFDRLGTNDAVTIGRPSNGAREARVVTKRMAAEAHQRGDHSVISRSKEHFHFPQGVAGWLLLDVDPKSMPPEVRQRVESYGGLLDAVLACFPELRGCEYLAVPSSSAGVTRGGFAPDPLYAMHVYVLVPDLSEAQAIVNNLHARCWGMGLAWWAISASGARLDRGLIDLAVASPERLAFESEPLLGAGLVRHKMPSYASAGPLARLPQPPSNDNWKQRRRDAWRKAEAAADATKAQHRANYIARQMAQTGVSEATAAAVYDRALSGKPLSDDFMLPFVDGRTVRVGDILDSLDQYRIRKNGAAIQKVTLPDPLEGHDYHQSAALMWGVRYDQPIIVSRAHGRDAIFVFERYTKTAPAQGTQPDGAAPNVTDKRSPEWQSGRRKMVAAASDELKLVVDGWLGPLTKAATVRKAVAEADAAADAEAEEAEVEAGGFDDPSEGDLLKKRLRRQKRKAVRDHFGLGDIPDSKFSLPAGGYKEDYGTIPENPTVSGSQGIGKTSAFHGNDADENRPAQRGAAHSAVGLTVFYAQPTTEKGRESFELYNRNATPACPVAIQLLGRMNDDPDRAGHKMCLQPKLVDEAQRLGESVRSVCDHCPTSEECGYLKQEQRVANAVEKGRGLAIFGDQSYIHTGLPVQITPDAIVVDEMQRELGVEKIEIPLDRLTDVPLPKIPRKQDEAEHAYTTRRKNDLADWNGEVVGVLSKLKQATTVSPKAAECPSGWILDQVEQARLSPEDLLNCARLVAQRPRNSDLFDALWRVRERGDDVSERMAAMLAERTPAYPHSAVATLLRSLAKELNARSAARQEGREPKQRMAAIEWKNAAKQLLTLSAIRPNRYRSLPMMHLDGTGSAAVSSQVFGKDFDDVRISAPRNAITTLVTDRRFSKSALIGASGNTTTASSLSRQGGDAQRLRQDIMDVIPHWSETVGVGPEKTMVVTTKQVRTVFEEEGCNLNRVTHYGALRGDDSFKDCDGAVLVGRQLPPTTAVEDVAAAFSTGRLEDFQKATNGYIRSNLPNGGVAFSLPDPASNMVLQQMFYAEISQAVDRVRPMFCQKPKQVLLMTDAVPADIEVDQTSSWEYLRNEIGCFANILKILGFVPMSATALVRLDNVKGLLSGDLKLVDVPNRVSLGKITNFTRKPFTRQTARTLVEKAKALKDLIGVPSQLADAGLPTYGTWFALKIKLDVPAGEKAMYAFKALGWAASEDEMRAKVNAAFNGTGFTVEKLDIVVQHQSPDAVTITNMPAMLPDGTLLGECGDYVIKRDLLPDRLRGAQSLQSEEKVSITPVPRRDDPRRHHAYVIDFDLGTAKDTFADRISVAVITDLHCDETQASCEATRRASEALRSYGFQQNTSETTTGPRGRLLRTFTNHTDAQRWADGWRGSVDMVLDVA